MVQFLLLNMKRTKLFHFVLNKFKERSTKNLIIQSATHRLWECSSTYDINNIIYIIVEWSGGGNGEYRVRRQLSVSSDSKLLDEGAREDARVIMRPKRPPRPKSEAFLGPHDHSNRRTKRFSAFGVS